MKISDIISVEVTEHGYDTIAKTSTGNVVVIHCDEGWVIQNVSRIEYNAGERSYANLDQYSVIPQECRVAIQSIKGDNDIINGLLYQGVWYNNRS